MGPLAALFPLQPFSFCSPFPFAILFCVQPFSLCSSFSFAPLFHHRWSRARRTTTRGFGGQTQRGGKKNTRGCILLIYLPQLHELLAKLFLSSVGIQFARFARSLGNPKEKE